MTTSQNKSIIYTTVIHIIVALILFFVSFEVPNPPFKEELSANGGGGGGGSFVEFGTMEISDVAPAPAPEPTPEEEIMTNDDEQTVSIDQPEKKKDKPEKKEKVKEQPKVKVELVEVPKTDPRSLFKKGPRNKSATQQGIGEGEGLGDGKGPGTGSGEGDGKGGGKGNVDGFGYDLTGRTTRSAPKVVDNSQETGTVVINITVDKNGNVISASGPGRGSTTTSVNLVKKSKEAAEKVKFSTSNVEVQKGTMTFNYFVK